MLFVPGHLKALIPKAARSEADCVVMDLQDGVPPDMKSEARVTIRQTLESGLFKHKRVMVRLNPPDTGMTPLDVEAVACEPLNGFVYPMANAPGEIKDLDSMLGLREKTLGLGEGHFSVVVLVETPLGVINAYSLAKAAGRVVGLAFGAEDYLTELQGRYDAGQLVLHTPRAHIAMAARAAGVEAIDTPYVDVHDLEGLQAHARRARDLGMSGMLVISPRQIPIAHAVYTPSEEEVRNAEEIVRLAAEARQAGRSYAVVDGQLVSPSREKQARRILTWATAIKDMERRSLRPSISGEPSEG
jgi:citrate lyase subunit beta/citryl-CoA lyase